MIPGQTYRLIPSTYSLSNTQYMTITNANNALSNTDSTSYATVTHTRNSTTSYYLYLSGFNFDTVPNDADIISFSIKIKAYESDLSTSTNYSPRIQINNTNQTGTCPAINTTTRVLQFTGVTATFNTIKSAGNNFRLQLYVRRNSRNTQGYLYVYGAEIEVVTGTKYEINVTSKSLSSITVPSNQTVSEYGSTTLTFNNVDIETLAFIDNGVNITNTLVNTTGNTYTYTIDNILEDHNIVINDVPTYNVTVTENDPNNIFSVSPLGVTPVGQGSNIEIVIETDDRNSIVINDNNTNVSQLLVPGKELSNTKEESFGLSQYEGGTLSIAGTNYPAAYGANSADNTGSYARFYTATTGTTLDAVYLFNVNIPSDAEIVSVSCRVHGYCYNGGSYYTIRTAQLYAGNVPMGSAYTFPTSNSTFNLNCGDWTAVQLANCKLKILCNSTSTSTNYNIRFYGATLIVQYKEYVDSETISIYKVSNINSSHDIDISEASYKTISGTVSQGFNGSFSNLPKKIYVNGDSYTVILTGITNRYSFRLKDNNNDVTSSVNTTNYQYTISNITSDHTLILLEAPSYSVTEGNSTFSGITISGTSNKVYQGDSITITINGITDPDSYTLYDDDVDVTSQVNSSYQYTISNVQQSHTLRIEENDYVTISGSSPLVGPVFTNLPKKIYEANYGSDFTVTLTAISVPNSFILKDNDADVTNFVDNNQYLIQNINEDHSLIITEAPYYSVTEENSTLSGATLSGLTNKAYEGNNVNIEISGVSNPYSIKLLDNGVDVSNKLQIPESIFTYDVETTSGASFGFVLNNDGYYESTNKGQANSAAVCRVTFNLSAASRVTIKYINYAEATYDYGIFGNIDSALNTTYTADTNVKYACSSNNDNSEYEQTLTYDINEGEHFIDIKYRKDPSTDSYNDSLQFKIDSITPTGSVVIIPTYIIYEISENHILTVSQQDIITVTTSSGYGGASLAPASSTIYKGEPLELTLTVSDISLISVRITNSKTKIVTGAFRDNGDGTYTGTLLGIRENSTVTVIQKVSYTITCTDNSSFGDITPTGSQTVDGGYDVEYVIDSDYFNRIYLKDNNVIVNDFFERHELPEITNTFIPASFDSTNSTYSSIYNSNNPENGLTESNSSTRCCVYSNTGANAVSKLIYNFDCSSIPENATIDSVTCTAGAACYSSGQYFSTRTLQLYSGDTAKGTATTITGNGGTNTSHTLNCGTWTRDELNNIKIIVYIARSTSNTTTNASFSFWGATLSITYHEDYYAYTLENISANHTLVLSDRPTYQLTASSTTQNGTITPTSITIYENNDAEFIISTVNIAKIKLFDNDTDVTGSIIYENGDFKYIIENVSSSHTVVLKNKAPLKIRDGNTWKEAVNMWVRINGAWVQKDEISEVFDTSSGGKIYISKKV